MHGMKIYSYKKKSTIEVQDTRISPEAAEAEATINILSGEGEQSPPSSLFLFGH
jgi:hypothetical protein